MSRIKNGLGFRGIFLVLLFLTYWIPSCVSASSPFFKQGLQEYTKGNYSAAKKHFIKAVEKSPDSPRHYFFLGNTYQNLDKSKKAIKSYKSALKHDSSYRSAREKLADLYYNKERWKRASQQYRILLKNEPENLNNHFRLGVSYFHRGKLSMAKKQFLRVREGQPENSKVHYYLGRVLLKREENLNAASRLTRAIELNPSVGKYYFYRALAYFREEDYLNSGMGRWKSGNDFQRAIELGYKSPEIHFMYGNSLLNRGFVKKKNGEMEKAVDLFYRSIDQFREVLSGKSNASNAYHNMGMAYLGIGKLGMASKSVQEAILLEPDVPFFHDTLGIVYFRLGKFNKAIESWRLVSELASDYGGHPFSSFIEMESLEDKISTARIRLK